MDSLIPQTPEESLYAFMDGELDAQHEQPLFDALAQDTSLRSEMKDLLSIRSAVHRDIVAPPAQIESRILSGITGPSLAGNEALLPAATVGVLPRVMTILRAPVVIGIGGMLAGMALMYGILDSTDVDASPVVVDPAPVTLSMTIPASSAEESALRQQTIVYRYRDRPATTPASFIPSQASLDVQPPESTPAQAEQPVGTSVAAWKTVPVYAMQTSGVPIQPLSASTLDVSGSASMLHDIQFRMRSLPDGIGRGMPVPASITQTIMPNTAMGVSMPVGIGHRLGVEAAMESFRQEFTDVLNGRQVTYTQTPTLFWLGATYTYQPLDYLLIQGLQPYVELMAGAVPAQGPIGHSSIGLLYRPIGPVAIMAGINGSAMLYRHTGNWYSSTKWGLTYGISVDLGRLP